MATYGMSESNKATKQVGRGKVAGMKREMRQSHELNEKTAV